MSYRFNHYPVIDAFFDCYGLLHARAILSRMIKTADAEKIWKGRSPADLLYFVERLEELIEAVFSLTESYDHKTETILNESDNDTWLLNQYETYCGWHIHSSPWDFFPRHLSKKEFLDPYRALEKFTRYQSLNKWKAVLKEILSHALSPNSISEFDDGTSILGTWLQLHKLLEATHLIHVRSEDETKRRQRYKWKDRERLIAGDNPDEEKNPGAQPA